MCKNSKTPKGRRKLAVQGEDMYCAQENSCLVEKQSAEEIAGPLSSFHQCYDQIADSFYPITSYNTLEDNSDLTIPEKFYCSDYTYDCGTFH